jgi:hypothetical protein
VACDAVRFATGFEAVGLLDMTFVWLFAQQLGFWIADGWFRKRSPATVAAIGAGAYLLLFGLVGLGYPGNMLDNLYPPTFAIVALALGQTCLMVLAHPALTRLMAVRPVQVVVATVGSRLMTIYLWHVPVLALVIGVLLLTPLPTPAAGSAAWWWTRPVVFVVVVVVLALISALFGRLERPSPNHHPSDWATGLAAACMVIPSFALMAWGLDFLVAASSALILTAAVLLLNPVPARYASAEPRPSPRSVRFGLFGRTPSPEAADGHRSQAWARSRTSSRTRAASALPCIAFMTAPMTAPAACTLPSRIFASTSGCEASASSIAATSAPSSDTTARPRASTISLRRSLARDDALEHLRREPVGEGAGRRRARPARPPARASRATRHPVSARSRGV